MTAPQDKPKTGGFNPLSRDNLEALTMAIIMAVMLKYFVVEAYKIPTGSMQPTLMGDARAEIYDRIIVDKLSYHFRDPERFEVAVFKYPLNRAQNFIKRICGMPGEELMIRNGDLFVRPDGASDWKILRRPRPVQQEVWKRIDPANRRFAAWKPLDGVRTWSIDGRAKLSARGTGAVRVPNDDRPIYDDYGDGYPGDLAGRIVPPQRSPMPRPVGDVRLEGDVKALAGCKSVSVELREGSRRYVLTIPGPAASADAKPSARADVEQNVAGGPLERAATSPFRLSAGSNVSFAAQNMDDELQLEIDGEIVLTLEIPETNDTQASITLRVEGEGADFDDLEVFRDIYYTEGAQGSTFVIEPGHYVMLGDNTQNSSDSREWSMLGFEVSAPGSPSTVVRGNDFPGNPYVYPGEPTGPRVFVRDVWGELHTFRQAESRRLTSEWAPLVPRDLVIGRAVIVFWPPFSTRGSVLPFGWRLKWIH